MGIEGEGVSGRDGGEPRRFSYFFDACYSAGRCFSHWSRERKRERRTRLTRRIIACIHRIGFHDKKELVI